MPTERDKRKNHPGKVAGVFCLKHAYEYESEISPWRLLLPVHHKYLKVPPMRLPDGRLYQMEVIPSDKVEPVTSGLVYSPRQAAWVEVGDKARKAPFRKPPFEDGPAADYLHAAVGRLPFPEGLVTIIAHETMKNKYEKLLRIALRFQVADGVSALHGCQEQGTYRPQG